MAERLILELKSKFKYELQVDEEKNKEEFQISDIAMNKMLDDLHLTLQSLNYTKTEIKNVLQKINTTTVGHTKKEKNFSFENLLKIAINYLDNNSSNLVR